MKRDAKKEFWLLNDGCMMCITILCLAFYYKLLFLMMKVISIRFERECGVRILSAYRNSLREPVDAYHDTVFGLRKTFYYKFLKSI